MIQILDCLGADLIIYSATVMTLDFVFKYIYMFGFFTYPIDNKKN